MLMVLVTGQQIGMLMVNYWRWEVWDFCWKFVEKIFEFKFWFFKKEFWFILW
jgi:hypothetical protein